MLEYFQKMHCGSITCDSCSFSEDIDGENFHDFIQAAKEEGWRVKPDGKGDWEHTCSSCIEDEVSGEDLEDSI